MSLQKSPQEGNFHTDKRQSLLVISDDDVIACGGSDMEIVEPIIRDSFLKFASGECCLPHKTITKPPFSPGQMNVMPCALKTPTGALFGAKLVRVGTASKAYPTTRACVALFDEVTNQLSTIICSDTLSACRTGAATRLAARYVLSGTLENVLLIGAGPNMKQQLIALQPFLDSHSCINVFSRGDSKYDFAESMRESSKGKILPLDNLDQSLIASTDVFVGCIPNPDIANAPIKNATLKKGATFINLGLYDTDIETMCAFDRYVTDSWAEIRARGDIAMVDAFEDGLISTSDIVDLTPYLHGQELIRKNQEEKLLVSMGGLGSHDVLVGKYIYEQCEKRGLGTRVILDK